MTKHISFTTRPGIELEPDPAERIATLEAALYSIAHNATEAQLVASGPTLYDLSNIEKQAREVLPQS